MHVATVHKQEDYHATVKFCTATDNTVATPSQMSLQYCRYSKHIHTSCDMKLIVNVFVHVGQFVC